MKRRSPWQPPATAPRDMTVFLGDFGLPWPRLAAWNPVQEKFVVADPQIDQYEGLWRDSYFENDYLPAEELRGWMPLPEVVR